MLGIGSSFLSTDAIVLESAKRMIHDVMLSRIKKGIYPVKEDAFAQIPALLEPCTGRLLVSPSPLDFLPQKLTHFYCIRATPSV